MSTYNRFNVSILCVADSEDDVALYGQIKNALKVVPKTTVKVINLDLWQDCDGKTREFNENGEEIFSVPTTSEVPVVDEDKTTPREETPEVIIEDL